MSSLKKIKIVKVVKLILKALSPFKSSHIQLLIKMFLKPVWVGKIHGVEVYATHVVRIW